MKNIKLKVISGVVLGIVLLPVASFAQEATTTKNREAIKTQIEQKREEIKKQVEQRKEELKTKIEERKQLVNSKIDERLGDFIGKLEKRFDSAIERLEILVTRIESRIAKMDDEDIDTTKAKELLTDAKTKIATAKTSILAIGTKADEVLAGDVRALYPELKEVVAKAKTDVKSAHEALVLVVRELKPGFNKSKDGRGATSTATTTSTN